jgi:hypothetical protein
VEEALGSFYRVEVNSAGQATRWGGLQNAVKEGPDEIERGEGFEFRSIEELDREIDRTGEKPVDKR